MTAAGWSCRGVRLSSAVVAALVGRWSGFAWIAASLFLSQVEHTRLERDIVQEACKTDNRVEHIGAEETDAEITKVN
eukprot:225211-Pyramimonas_sp.AAC.1